MEIIIGSNNSGKIKEMQAGLEDNEVSLVSYTDYGILKKQPRETGKSYQENAYLKALFYYQELKKPILADDGGLDLAAFPEYLGLKTSRQLKGTDQEKNCQILKLYQDPKLNRGVTLTASLVYLWEPESYLSVTKAITGQLVEPRGENGYGFDAIFYLPQENQTFAEMSAAKRYSYSPRIQALKKIIKKIKENGDV